MEITVRAMPAPGHERRWRAGRPWTKNPTVVRVVDKPNGPNEIDPADYAKLQADPHIAVSPVGGDDPAVPVLKAALIEANAEIEKLRRQLSDAAEESKAEQAVLAKQLEEAGRKVVELEAEKQQLKDGIAKAAERAKERMEKAAKK